MKKYLSVLIALPLMAAEGDPPAEWVEPSTGHRVVRLSKEAGSASLYFHQNPYTETGDKMVFTTPGGISVIHLRTRQIEPVVEGRSGHIIVGKKTRTVFYTQGDAVYATNLDTKATRKITTLPAEVRMGSGFAVNADETLLGGSYVKATDRPAARPAAAAGRPEQESKAGGFVERRGLEERFRARLPMALFTIDIKTGELKAFYHANDWLNHVQFSPTDPTLMMYCHEGPWHLLDRIWTIRIDGSGRRLMHKRTMDMEIAGHEFFDPSGKIIWYDLQTPRSKVFWLAGVNIETGEQKRYPIEREHWSVHYNISADGKLFAGDGGGPRSVAAPGNGQWIYLFRPQNGTLQVERLVDLAKHDYRLEPNVTFTPDRKWIVFRSNMHGPTHVYAVEVEKGSAGGSD
jgi:oligogalacturonide lyase